MGGFRALSQRLPTAHRAVLEGRPAARSIHAGDQWVRQQKPFCRQQVHPGQWCHASLLETFTDADWSGNERNRRSMSSSAMYLNGCMVYTTLISGACDSIFMKRVVEFLLDEEIMLVMRTGNQSCKQAWAKARGVQDTTPSWPVLMGPAASCRCHAPGRIR